MLTNVKLALTERRLRQADLALAIGVPPTTLSEYVNGRREMPPHLKTRIAEVLQADPAWLFSHVPTHIPAFPKQDEQPVASTAAA